jgi:hypothetical protein
MSNGKINFVLVIFLLMDLNVCVNSLAAQSKDLKTFKVVNFSLGGRVNENEANIAGMINIGIGTIFELEANLLFWPNILEDVVISGNLSLSHNIFITQLVIPFATIGLGMCLCPVPWLNYGYGIRTKLTESLGIRTEFHSWFCYDFEGNYILVGTSYYL